MRNGRGCCGIRSTGVFLLVRTAWSDEIGMMHLRERWLTEECVDAALGRPARGAGIPVFRNGVIDRRLARAHPLLPLALYGPISGITVLTAHRSGYALREGLAFLAGWLVLSLVEYLLHRFYFHRETPSSRAGRIEAFLAHGYHHQYPNDVTRLVLPPLATLPLAGAVFLVMHVALGTIGHVVFAGVLAGYIAYDTLHYVSHHTRARRGPIAWLRRYHLLHHSDHAPTRYGVSSPLWDLVFRTYAPPVPRRRAQAGRAAVP